jgi:hypothetical protein
MGLEKYERNKESKEHIKKHGYGPMKVSLMKQASKHMGETARQKALKHKYQNTGKMNPTGGPVKL